MSLAVALLILTFGLQVAFVAAVAWLNLRHLRRHGDLVPAELAGRVAAADLRRIRAYVVDRERAALAHLLVRSAALAAFLFAGPLGWYDRLVATAFPTFVGGGMVFFLGLALAEAVLDLPFGIHRTFRVEARHGFNTTTWRLWLADLAKGAALSAALLALAAGGALGLVLWSPERWWLWTWSFFLLLGLALTFLSPVLIEPLFLRFRPLEDAALEGRIRDLLARAGLAARRVLQVDASRRSRHSNAYFTGIGRVRRIVLFDTLLRRMGTEEILAVVAHEAGHWRMRHVPLRFVLFQGISLAGLYAAHRLLGWDGLPSLAGLKEASFPARAVLVGFLASLISFPLGPALRALSRRHEVEADRFACELTGRPQELASALATLAQDNLSNLHPHPLYAALHYTHPPLVERLRRIREAPVARR